MKNLEIIAFICSIGVLYCSAAPVEDNSTVYDQRQNGTENYRINVDGVMLAIAPADALLAAASAYDLEDLLGLGDFGEGEYVSPAGVVSAAPQTAPLVASHQAQAGAAADVKPAAEEKPVKRKGMKLRLATFLRPFLRKYRQQ